jgi:hypothetical protein
MNALRRTSLFIAASFLATASASQGQTGSGAGSTCSVTLWNGSVMIVHCDKPPAGRYVTCFVSCSPSGKVTGVSCRYVPIDQEPPSDPDCVVTP